jgi:hypothetical protein
LIHCSAVPRRWWNRTTAPPIAWFIVGLIFTVFAAAAVLYQAGQDRKKQAMATDGR